MPVPDATRRSSADGAEERVQKERERANRYHTHNTQRALRLMTCVLRPLRSRAFAQPQYAPAISGDPWLDLCLHLRHASLSPACLCTHTQRDIERGALLARDSLFALRSNSLECTHSPGARSAGARTHTQTHRHSSDSRESKSIDSDGRRSKKSGRERETERSVENVRHR